MNANLQLLPTSLLAISAPKQNLRRLLTIRWLVLVGLIFGALAAKQFFAVALPYKALAIILSLIIVFNFLTGLRLKQLWPLTELEFAAQIFVDIVGISVIFYFCGGATNPFVSYYLVPLAISAATLPWIYTTLLALLSLSAYTTLLFSYMPIVALEPNVMEIAHQPERIHPHIVGMWFNFILSASLITFFVMRMSSALRQREQQLAAHREENLRDEQVLAVANLAAGTAHELGSPLTTMKVLLAEMEHDQAGNPSLLQDINVLKTQVNQCSQTLKKLVSHSEVKKQDQIEAQWVADYCARVFEQWLIIRPDVNATVIIDPNAPALKAFFHSTVEQAVINLLNNAGDASPAMVDVHATWDMLQLTIAINDNGPGLSKEVEQQLGQAFVTTKGRGLGLGLFLSNATLNRYGGKLNFYARTEGGTRTEISIPLNNNAADKSKS